jgi:hypothetical protein
VRQSERGETLLALVCFLLLDERDGSARLAGRELRAGDWLSIDGRTGNIFIGRISTLVQTSPQLA